MKHAALIAIAAAVLLASSPARADSTDEGSPELLPVDLDVSYELLGSDTASARGWRGHLGYVGELGRRGRWVAYYGAGVVLARDRVVEKSSMAVEYRWLGGAEARLGGAYASGRFKLLEAYLFADALYAEDAIDAGGLAYRAGAALSWTTISKIRVAGLMMSDDDGFDHEDDKGLGVVLGLLGSAMLLVAPTSIQVFAEDSPGDGSDVRYGVAFGWHL